MQEDQMSKADQLAQHAQDLAEMLWDEPEVKVGKFRTLVKNQGETVLTYARILRQGEEEEHLRALCALLKSLVDQEIAKLRETAFQAAQDAEGMQHCLDAITSAQP